MVRNGKIVKIFLFILFAICFFAPQLSAQFNYKEILGGERKIVIPFEYEEGFIIMEVALNNSLPLTFIFDTGAENTILLEKLYAQLMGLSLEEEVDVIGSDNKTVNIGYISRRVPLSFAEGGAFVTDILVLEDHTIDFTNIIGRKVDGIIGGNILMGSVFKIDYRRQELTFYDTKTFKKPNRFEEHDIEISRQRPFVKANVAIGDQEKSDLKLLVDTGAGLHFLLDELSHPEIQMPDSVVDGRIGEGLGGNLGGFLGNVNHFYLLNDQFSNVPVYFQRKDTMELPASVYKRRNGIVGNVYWARHRVIMDYSREKLYIKTYRKKKKKFRFNKSGIVVFATGTELEDFVVKYVAKGSSAELAGVKPGDLVLSLNNWPHQFMTLEYINKKLSGKEGELVKMMVKRKGERLKFSFRLKSNKIELKD